jgi:tellurite resistance protein TerC
MQLLAWAGFLALIGVLLALDLGVFHRKDHVITAKSALRWTFIWFLVALSFNVAIYFIYEKHLFGFGVENATGGRDGAIQFFTGYLVEQSLSIDNIFVIALVFRFFKVDPALQHRVLFWGILGAIVLRISMILLGAALITRFSFMTYVFGAILLITAARMALSKGDDDFDPEESHVVKFARRIIPISKKLDGAHFFTKVDGKTLATPLFLVLLVVEGTDIVFAVDSIPAIFGVTQDPFIVFSSNIFAILGLRSLYFALASLLRDFHYLKHSLVVVLAFVGAKMILAGLAHVFHDDRLHISSLVSLGVIVACLGGGVLASILRKEDEIKEDLPDVSERKPQKDETPGAKKDDVPSEPPSAPVSPPESTATDAPGSIRPSPDPAPGEMEP